MVYIGAKVWGKRPFFGDSIFLFLMYDVWAALCFLRCTQRPYTAASLQNWMKTCENGYHREKEIPGITARVPTIYKPTKVYERNCMIVILI